MKKSIIIFHFLALSLLGVRAQEGQHILKQGYTVDFFTKNLLEPAQWVPYPSIQQSEKWKALLPPKKYVSLIKSAESYIGYQWPVTRASVFLEFVQNGNRTRFEEISFSRRTALAALVVGELLENKGRFINDIVDGVWSICEESFWGVPAHLNYQKKGVGLADVTDPIVDLFAAETASLLAWVSYLTGEKLDKVSPLITERIYVEIDRRIFKVIEKDPQYRWMGYNRNKVDSSLSYEQRSFLQRRPNNWNPWISSNVLSSILLLEKNKTRRAAFVYKIFDILDNYIDPYPADGGCDEGPGYWGRAAASTFDCLDLVQMATKQSFNLLSNPLIKNMGEFIFKAYIGNGYYLNFADAGTKTNHSPMLIYRYGKAVQSQTMMEMGAYLAQEKNVDGNAPEAYSLLRKLPELYFAKELLVAPFQEPLVQDSWLPDIQVMVSRDQPASKKGLFLAAKAGHNQESHNHDDVGSFMIFKDGNPALIDVGAGTYTKDYGKSWVLSSAYHNLLPVINGEEQLTGRKYSASNVVYAHTGNEVVFKQDISKTYSENSGINKWERTFTHKKGKSIVIVDAYDCKMAPTTLMLPMMLVALPDVSKLGKLVIKTGDDSTLSIDYDAAIFTVEIETIPLQDAKIAKNWGNTLYRAQFIMKKPAKKGNYRFVIQ